MIRTIEPAEQTDILLAHEAAKYLRISERTLHTLTKSGEIPCSNVGWGKRYSRSALKAFMENGGTAPRSRHARK